jgi:hypothetical protein
MQIRHHLSAEQVHHLDVTLGRDWQERSSKKDLLNDELVLEPKRDQLYDAREGVGKKPRKRVSALPKQRHDK